MHRKCAALAALILLLFLMNGCGVVKRTPVAPEPAPVPTWTMEGGDASGRARVDTAAPRSWNHFGILKLTPKRSNFRLGEFCTPLVAGKNIYAASSEKALHAVRWKDGKRVWTFPMQGRVYASLAWWNGLILCADDEGQLVAVDTRGVERWRFSAPYPIVSSPIVVGDRIYLLVSDQNLFALEAETGEPVWQYEQTEPAQGTVWRGGSLSAAEGLVFVGFSDGYVLALENDTGRVRWRTKITRRKLFPDVVAGPVYDNGRVVAGTRDGPLVAMDAATGETVWANEGPAASGIAVGAELVYVGLPGGGVRAVSKETGETVWTTELAGGLSSPPLVAGPELLVGTEEGDLHALDVSTGAVNRSYTPGPGLSSRVWIGEPGLVFLSNGGALHRVKNGR